MTPPSRSLDVLATLSPSVSAGVAARADRWGPDDVAAVPRVSASVVLLRDTAAGLETYLLHRHARMAFAASTVVFPGGGVDPVDGSAPDPVLACGVRETAEETGVVLQAAALARWAHWVTPTIEPRRYDTHFYVAALPAGQEAADVSSETDRAAWTRPADALAAASRGEIALMAPTLSILTELAAVDSPAPDQCVDTVLALAHDRVIGTVLPVLERSGSVWFLRYRGDEAGSDVLRSDGESSAPLSSGAGGIEALRTDGLAVGES